MKTSFLTELVKYSVYFVVAFVLIYLLYYIFVVNGQIRIQKGKSKKKKKDVPAEVMILRDYYKIDIEKIGIIRVLRILNFVNALMLALLTMVAIPFKKVYFKFGIIIVLIIPTIWFTYYFLAKYLKYLEGKED